VACGAGAVCCDLPAGTLSSYVGVDISSQAISRARARTAELAPLAGGQRFLVGSITDDAVQQNLGDDFDVVLFNECIYYLPAATTPSLLAKLGEALSPTGVFIFRIHDRERWAAHVEAIRASLLMIEDVPSRTSMAVTLAGAPHRP
jgi:SAM-dependent methyltransferase